MHVAHWLGIVGLVLNTAGALALLRFNGNPFKGSPLTRAQIGSVMHGSPEFRRMDRQISYYRGSIIAIAVGFLLQLADLLLA
ncbi:MAG: hypothetical protein ABI859_08140 [Pseudomonadota bacterium]